MSPTDFETVIGLEVHFQLKTKTKIFCGCANEFGGEPNTHVCAGCLALPGSLPVLNKQVVEDAIRVGLALNASINTHIQFERKSYFYPDLSTGYQLSQFEFPIAKAGFLMIPTPQGEKRIGITRAHMEEDAGKLIHDEKTNASLVDYNRAATPLVEIVSEPDMRSPQEAYDYLTTLKLILSYLGVSDCDMEKGSLRCDANISIRPRGQTTLGTKTELKNMNSFSAVKRSLEYEIDRQKKLVLSGEKVIQQTRLWDEEKGITQMMRSKEKADDYRYFPDPNLVPFTITTQTIEQIQKTLPELPFAKKERLMKQYQLSEYDAHRLIQEKTNVDFFEKAALEYEDAKKISNWMTVQVLAELNERKVSLDELKLTPKQLTDLIQKVEGGFLSNVMAKDILKEIMDTGADVEALMKTRGLDQMATDEEIEKVINELIAQNPSVIAQIQGGKSTAAGFFVGQTIKKMQGKANPKKVTEILSRRLKDV